MSWTLLLNKYPRAILDSPKPLLVLALVDRAGLSTEAELAEQIKGDLPELRKILLKLQMAEFLAMGEHHVKLTEAGREVIDRLSLVDDVLRDILDGLQLQGEDRSKYKIVLEEYRRDSFQLYQNSVCTMRQWSRITSNLHANESHRNIDSEITAGLRSLLSRDLRNWAFHSRRGLNATRDYGHGELTFVWIDEPPKDCIPAKRSALSRTTAQFMQALLSEERDIPKKKNKNELILLDMLLAFHGYQSSQTPDIWFDRFCVDFRTPSRRTRNSLSSLVDRVSRSLVEITPNSDTATASLQHYVHAWRPEKRRESNTADLTAKILESQSLEDFCSRSGLTPRESRALLTDVNTAVTRLLSSGKARK